MGAFRWVYLGCLRDGKGALRGEGGIRFWKFALAIGRKIWYTMGHGLTYSL